MGIFNKGKPNDVIFLMPVRLAGEKLPKGKVRMLFSDAAGEVYTFLLNRSVYDLARENAEEMGRCKRSFATIGLETGRGDFTPAIVEISTQEVWALEHILEHALKKGRLPDILKQYLKPIIKQGAANREALIAEYKGRRRRPAAATPRVLERLPYYPEGDVEFSMPIYKAEYRYPLTVLKRLPTGKHDSSRSRRLLILDSDGDSAVIGVPVKLANEVERGLREHQLGSNGDVCAIISRRGDGLAADYIKISRLQRKALDTIVKYFEETGSGKLPISAAARKVLSRAREKGS